MGRGTIAVWLWIGACASTAPRPALPEVQTWAMQLTGIDDPRRMERLEESDYQLLVIDQVDSVRGLEGFKTAELVKRLRERRLVLAYLNVGQAEEYRTHWSTQWRAPTKEKRGDPPFLLTVDPDGWKGDYPVAYWDKNWIELLHRRIDRIVGLGFDGVYCDWVLGYEDPTVVQAARAAGVDPRAAMASLLRDLRIRAHARNPGFLLVMQNGAGLLLSNPELAAWVDGVSQEAVSFYGKAGAKWDDPASTDRPIPATGDWSTETLMQRLRAASGMGLPIFVIDYAAKPENIALARRRAGSIGAIPFISRAPLDRLPND
ncbi:MAG: endo alpha-1,4 polygalactosaminidase [Planctomycetota bacterium]